MDDYIGKGGVNPCLVKAKVKAKQRWNSWIPSCICISFAFFYKEKNKIEFALYFLIVEGSTGAKLHSCTAAKFEFSFICIYIWFVFVLGVNLIRTTFYCCKHWTQSCNRICIRFVYVFVFLRTTSDGWVRRWRLNKAAKVEFQAQRSTESRWRKSSNLWSSSTFNVHSSHQ